jgi:hypothetical protein
LASIDVVARLNLCLHDHARLAKDLMRPTIVRSLVAQRPHFRTFAAAGLELPTRLRDLVMAMPYTYDSAVLAPATPLVPDAFVDALTLAGTVEDVADCVVRMVLAGVTHVMIAPMAPEGDVERTLRRFAAEVMPSVRQRL